MAPKIQTLTPLELEIMNLLWITVPPRLANCSPA